MTGVQGRLFVAWLLLLVGLAVAQEMSDSHRIELR